jgi:glycosyltransferase involved in cell wall biosynthesis
MSPTRVLHAVDSLRPGGAQTVLATRVSELGPNEDFEQHLLVISARGLDTELHERLAAHCQSVTVLGADSLRDRDLFRSAAATLDSVDPHLVHSHLATANVVTRLAARRRQVPHVSTIHTPPGPHTEDGRGRDLAEGVTAGLSIVLTAPADCIASAYSRRWRISRSRIRVIPNPVPPCPPSAAFSRDEARASLGASGDTVIVLSTARLMAAKGLDDLIVAASDLPDQRLLVLLAGDGPERRRLEAMIGVLGIGGRVKLLGERADIGDLIALSDVFCLPSHHEGAPMGLIEAMAGGLPSVATTVGGIPEIVTEGSSGLLVAPGAPMALAEALRRLMNDPGLRAHLGSGARQATAPHDAGAVARAHEAIYRRVLASGRHTRRIGRIPAFTGAGPGVQA